MKMIDFSKVIDFSEEFNEKDIQGNIKKLKIRGARPSDFLGHHLLSTMMEDYERKFCNYKGFIKDEIDIRIYDEIRRTLFIDKFARNILGDVEEDWDHTAIKNHRINYLKRYIKDYDDSPKHYEVALSLYASDLKEFYYYKSFCDIDRIREDYNFEESHETINKIVSILLKEVMELREVIEGKDKINCNPILGMMKTTELEKKHKEKEELLQKLSGPYILDKGSVSIKLEREEMENGEKA